MSMATSINPFPSFPASIAAYLKAVMNREKGKSRGNLGRLLLAVHTVFISTGFVLSNGKKTLYSSPDQPHPSDLCYSFRRGGQTAVLKFSVSENGDLVTVSASWSSNELSSTVHRVTLDLMKLAGPLIACLHGAIGDREERVIVEFWREVRSKICDPLRNVRCLQAAASAAVPARGRQQCTVIYSVPTHAVYFSSFMPLRRGGSIRTVFG